MDTSLNLTPTTFAAASAPAVERSVTSKVIKAAATDTGGPLPSDKPFIAQVVTARLGGAAFPENPSEIAPPERTLRPYDVPMLPFDKDDDSADMAASDRRESAETGPEQQG